MPASARCSGFTATSLCTRNSNHQWCVWGGRGTRRPPPCVGVWVQLSMHQVCSMLALKAAWLNTQNCCLHCPAGRFCLRLPHLHSAEGRHAHRIIRSGRELLCERAWQPQAVGERHTVSQRGARTQGKLHVCAQAVPIERCRSPVKVVSLLCCHDGPDLPALPVLGVHAQVPVTVPQLAPPAHLKPSPLLDLANAWADKYHSGDAKEGEQVSAEESADSALQNPCRASWLAHVRSATRMQQQQQQVSSPDRRRVSARPTASAPAPAPAPPAAAPNSDASRGPVPPVSGVWQRVPAGVPLSAHHFVPSSYPLLHYQPKAMAPGPVLTVGVPMAAQAQALMVQQQQKQQQRSALVSSAAQAPGMHHKTYSALQQHHRLMASIHSQAGGPVHPGHRQVDGATAMLHAMHQHQSRQQQQLEESMQHRWRRPSHAEASGSMVSEGFAHPGLADVRAAVNSSPRALAGRWARYNVLPGQCSPLGGTLLCDEDLVASPTRRGAAGGDGSPTVRKGLHRHAGAAGSDDSDGSKHAEEVEGGAMQGGADRQQPPSHQEGSRAAALERPAGPSATAAGDVSRRGRLGDLAKGAHPLMRGFADGSDLKRSRQGAGAGAGQAVAPGEAPRVQARDGAAAAAATAAGAEEVGEEDPLRHADWGQQRKRQRSARQEAPEASGHFRAGRTGSGGVANAHSGVDMLLALADAANTILAGDDAGGCGSQADDEERCQAGADEEEEALRGPGCSPGAGSVDDATQVVIAIAEDSSEGHKHGTSQQHQRQDGASRRWPWSCKEGAAGAQQCAEASGKGTGQDTRSSSQLQTSSGASEPMAVGPLPAMDGEQVGGQGRAACFTEQPHRLSTTGDRGRQGEVGAAAMLGPQPSPRRSMDLGAAVHAAMQVDGVVVAVATAPSALAGSRGEAAAAQGHCSVGTGARLSSAPCDVTADGSVDVAIRFKGGDGDGCSRLGSAPAAAKTAALSQDGVPAGAGGGSQPWLQTLSQLATDASCTAQERLDLMKAYMAMVQQGLTTQIE